MPHLEPHRLPAVADRFYPGDPRALHRELERCLVAAVAPAPARMILAPHAGYVYSGALAGRTWSQVHVPERVIVLCPNHTGRGVRRSIWPGGAWDTPDGPVPIAADLTDALVRHAGLQPDTAAHLREHAIEVQLPFLRARNPRAEIAAVCLGGLDLVECQAVGLGVAAAIRELEQRAPDSAPQVLLAASSDMSHYTSADEAAALDRLALDRLLALDPAGLYETVQRHEISMCGILPATVALVAALELGATRAELVGYTHSGKVTGDTERVVAYAGAVVQ
ncbi:AmmeMemoRadiSam system protein B [Nannocystis bainbridge]|uniref:MEMO1 family protein POL25_35210 n=1 Tax=Nannocystis bainbridge TaxID=2995303 RepID=A0ABT5E9A8_9BACT|nr:AmmeMemoRadiSam system protein B [Nannocystis bainbridge]MDC0722205.1 AmmeMemoRadiSam system protein B [Nannocystis bainbridge]